MIGDGVWSALLVFCLVFILIVLLYLIVGPSVSCGLPTIKDELAAGVKTDYLCALCSDYLHSAASTSATSLA